MTSADASGCRLEDLVRGAAACAPDRAAVKDAVETWSYRELDVRSDRLSRRFAADGVGPGDRVAVWAPKSCRVVAAFQAALRLGAAYVPIDPGTPAGRARKILEDCRVRLVVTTRTLAASLGPGLPFFFLDDGDRGEDLPVAPPAPPDASADAPAYLLYTSGSTGTPKGVCLSHRNALSFVAWAVREVGLDRPAVFSNHASFNFDLSVFDLYGAFLNQGTVCLVPEAAAYAAPQLVRFLVEHRIDVWYSVPSALVLMIDHGGLLEAAGPGPRVVLFAGEPFPIGPLRALRRRWSGSRFFNFYGPTETNVCTSYEVESVPDGAVSVPIGRAAGGDRVWAVREDGETAPVGEKGELWVEGPTVMLGYWGAEPQRGPYRTGDLCVLRPDGHYEFVGRRDHMIKVKGYRVEPGEVEAVLGGHPNVKEVAVLAAGDGLERRLVAFLVPRAAPPPTLLQVKAFGAKSLPPYMLVDRVEVLERLPRTPNGKIDRAALAERTKA